MNENRKKPKVDHSKLLYPDELYHILKCAMEVYNTLGSGFLETVYQDALEIEFALNGIPFEREKHIDISYKGQILPSHYIADELCYDKIILELKAASCLTQEHEAQLIHYLKATGINVGVLINFGKNRKLEWKRFVYTNEKYQNKNEDNDTTQHK